MRVRLIGMCAVLAVSTVAASAQMGGMVSMPAAGAVMTPAKAVDSQLSGIESEMISAVKAMPAEKFDFAPSTAIFVPGQKIEFATVRTFAQQATHVAQANYFMYGAVSGMKPDVDLAALSKLTKKHDVVAALAASFAFAHRAVATLTVANAFEVVHSEEGGTQTRTTMATLGVAHGFDHYGQMVEYLRMNGIVPPASAK